MNGTSTSPSTIHRRLGLCLLLLAWIVVGGLVWADLLDLHDEVGGPLADLQQAVEPDLDEVRDEGGTVRVVAERLDESLSIRPFLVSPSCSASYGVSVPTHCLLSKLSVYRL